MEEKTITELLKTGIKIGIGYHNSVHGNKQLSPNEIKHMAHTMMKDPKTDALIQAMMKEMNKTETP